MGKLLFACAAAMAVVAATATITYSAMPVPDIDGAKTTIALAAVSNITPADIILKLISLVTAIIKALRAPKFDYWANVKDDVKLVVGSYINNHSMNQVEHYSADLQTLLIRYTNAPVNGSDYADKDKQAATFNVNVMAHRYLVMSGDLKFSLLLPFQDVASMHIAVLKDVAATYSTPSAPSQWYVDLGEQLNTYLLYLNSTVHDLDAFRTGAIECVVSNSSCVTREIAHESFTQDCYDEYRIYDYVSGHREDCKQLHGRTDCVNTCSDYKLHIKQQMDDFVASKVQPVQMAWEQLYNFTLTQIPTASPYHNPYTKVTHKF